MNQIKRLFGAALVCLVLLAGALLPLQAAGYIGTVGPADILQMLQENGYEDVHIADTDFEDLPILNFTLADSDAVIYFYECGTIGKACELLQLKVIFKTDSRPSLKLINDFNAGKRFSQAYVDDQDDLVIEQWITLEGGISETNFLYTVISFGKVVDKLIDLIEVGSSL